VIGNEKKIRYLYVLIDAIVIGGACILTWCFIVKFHLWQVNPELSMIPFYLTTMCLIPEYLILFYVFDIYTAKYVTGSWNEKKIICIANLIGILIFASVTIFFKQIPYLCLFPRSFFYIFLILNTLMMICVRRKSVKIG